MKYILAAVIVNGIALVNYGNFYNGPLALGLGMLSGSVVVILAASFEYLDGM